MKCILNRNKPHAPAPPHLGHGHGTTGAPAGDQRDSVTFLINGKPYTVHTTDEAFGPESKLVDFIRNRAGLKGTKWMCREGGCGACVVTVRTKDPQSGQEVVRAVNSCLAPVFACDGYDISTVEDLGSKKVGYHPIQTRLAQFGGTQCGFCSSGMVMNMHALANSKKGNLTQQDVEDNFDGNLCRCTGYRPILDAMKSFAVDADPELKKRCADIEDICGSCPDKPTTSTKGDPGSCCGGGCCGRPADFSALPTTNLDLHLPTGEVWVKATDLKTVFETLKNFSKNELKYRIVAGNTGSGVFKYDGPYDAYIDVNNVPDLTVQSVNKTEAIIGGGNSLTRTIEFLQNLAKKQPGFEYTEAMARHIKRVANRPVRNSGTVAGNLMMKHAHHDFPSDIFLLLETVGAKIFVASSATTVQSYSPVDFLKVDMKGKLITCFTLPSRGSSYVFRSFKITKRFQNAHAYVNAGMLFKIDASKNYKVLEQPTITFGGIKPDFLRASRTEATLTGAELGDLNSLKKALKILEDEIQPDHHLPDASPKYRRSLTLNLLYKTVLGIVNQKVDKKLQSGGQDLKRSLQSGKQFYDIDKENEASALYKPVPKIEGIFQCAGEAQYVNDIPRVDGELYAAFVTATVANATLKTLDASEALKMPGVVRFLTAKDIPGKNYFWGGLSVPSAEELFVESKVLASGQALGLIIAETQDIANAAVKKVRVEYTDMKKPTVTLKEAIERRKKDNTFKDSYFPIAFKTAEEPSKTSKHVLTGEFQVGGQAHFHLETQVTLCVPREDGITVYAASQTTDFVQSIIAEVLKIPNNAVNVEIRRLGGAYGGKASRTQQVALAAALGTHLTGKPVRLVVDLETNMEMFGKREPYLFEYQVGFDDDGKIDGLDMHVICDPGMLPGDSTAVYGCMYIQNCYAVKGWQIQPAHVETDTHFNTFCRAPGSTQAIAGLENVIEHIAHKLGKDPLAVREANLLQKGDAILLAPGLTFDGENLIPIMVEEMRKNADYENRKKMVEEFNKNNRWIKRGLALVPMRYHQGYHGARYPSFVSIHNQDGSVSVSHGGIECGQGINTKVAQVVAHVFGIPLSKIIVKPTNNLVSANGDCTGGAITSELVCYATMQACEILMERMAPVKQAAEDGLTWEELVKKCHQEGIDLRGTYMYSKNDPVQGYDIYGLSLTEVEVDVLTGEHRIVRVDLIEDAGKSLSPEVDIGQIEGSLVMGIGLWTGEKLVFDPNTGRLLTRNTWEYKAPFHKCIPEQMQITIMRNAPNPLGVLRSKATGEPPLVLAVSVLFAIKNAIKAARKDAGNTDWFQLDGPVTPEDVVRLSLINPQSQFTY